MKKAFILSIALAFVIAWAIPATASPYPEGADVGKKIFQFNLNGVPWKAGKNFKGGAEDSSGKSIKIPLSTVGTPRSGSLVCPADGFNLIDDTGPTYTTSVPSGGVKLVWETSASISDFAIADRDATDGEAKILVPESYLATIEGQERAITFDVWIRVLGKPNQCMNIDAYAYDAGQALYFWAGTVELQRLAGKSTFQKVNELFDVWWCDVDTVTELCIGGTTEHLSVFDDVFSEYFWQIFNDGTRLVQVRITER